MNDRANRLSRNVDCDGTPAAGGWDFIAQRIAGILLAAFLTGASIPAMAKLPTPDSLPTDDEWRLLPAYCPDTQGFKYGHNSPNAPKWVSIMGETFWGLHHYCLGIMKFNRSQMLGYPPEIRSGIRVSALGEFAFVTRMMPENYILAPEIYTYIGRTHLLLNDPDEANAAFTRARTIKPDYWPAYSWWATYLADHGQKNQARAIATEGLEHSPNSRTLQLIMRDLDGKKVSSGTNEKSTTR